MHTKSIHPSGNMLCVSIFPTMINGWLDEEIDGKTCEYTAIMHQKHPVCSMKPNLSLSLNSIYSGSIMGYCIPLSAPSFCLIPCDI